MEFHDSYWIWPGVGWQKSKEDKAARMSISELHYARLDCDKAARSFPLTDNESKYRDEGSIYVMEMGKR